MTSVLALVFACLPALAAPVVPDYPAQKVAEHTFVIHGPTERPGPGNLGFMNNPAIVIGEDSVVILDPGSSLESGRMVLRQVASLTDKPVSHVFNSHIHGDHWLANVAIREAYPEAKFYAHPEMIKRAREGEAAEWIDMLMRMTENATDGTTALIPEHELADGQQFNIAGLTLRVHIIPAAHSHTDAMFEIVEDSLLYTGDNITYKRMPNFRHGTFRGSLVAIDRALELNLQHYVPGHGPSGGREVVENFQRFTSVLYNTVSELYEQGLSDFEMKDQVIEKMSDFHGWPEFEELIGRQINIAVLEAEKAAFE
jgi:glyoxylase-like metal-dependent hydrolase (beta-lactamase superfamily II)